MDYIELLEKYMQGLTTPEEEKALLDWIQHDGDARSTISAFYEKRWKETPDTGVSAELQYKMLMNIKQNICQHEIENQSAAGRKIVWMNVMKYAAAILATMVVSVFSAYYFYSSESDVKNFVVYADKGQRSNLVLPDGTKVWLNSDSKLEYDNTYGA
jgi:hypothetical protein BACCOPRO_03785